MTQGSYSIIFSGHTVAGHDPRRVKKICAALLHGDAGSAEAFFSGGPAVLYKNLSRETAEKYQLILMRAGALCEICPSDDPRLTQSASDAGRAECMRRGASVPPAPDRTTQAEAPPPAKYLRVPAGRAQALVRASLIMFLLTAAVAFVLTLRPPGPPRHLLLQAANTLADSVEAARAPIEASPGFRRLSANGHGPGGAAITPERLLRLIRDEQRQPRSRQAALTAIHGALEQARIPESFRLSREAAGKSLQELRHVQHRYSPAYANALSGLEQLYGIYAAHMDHAVNPLGRASFVEYWFRYRAYLGYFMAACETYIDAVELLQSNRHKAACRSEIERARTRLAAYQKEPHALLFAP